MAEYRWVVIKFPDGRKVRTIIEESDYYPDLVGLQRLYGVRFRIGRRVPAAVVARMAPLQLAAIVRSKGAVPARPLSPDFGRGSGAPV